MSGILGHARRGAAMTVLSSVTLILVAAPALASDQPINEWCPVLTDQKADPEITTVYQGKTVAFCCDRCRAKFLADPEKYAGRLPQFAGPATTTAASAQESREPEGHEHAGARVNTGAESLSDNEALSEEEELEHEHQHGEAGEAHGLGRLIAWLGNFHPPMVNFPIAMLFGAAVAELLRMVTKRPYFADAARFCLWFGALGALAAATLGWFFGGFHLTDHSWVMTTHRWLGTTTALWALLVLVLGERAYRHSGAVRLKAYRVTLFVGAALVMTTGFLGGAMVYGLDHYAW